MISTGMYEIYSWDVSFHHTLKIEIAVLSESLLNRTLNRKKGQEYSSCNLASLPFALLIFFLLSNLIYSTRLRGFYYPWILCFGLSK